MIVMGLNLEAVSIFGGLVFFCIQIYTRWNLNLNPAQTFLT